MDEEYDVIVLGTGLTECILSGMMSTSGKKVLHMDRNKYYGGESASLTPIEDFFEKMGQSPSDVSKFGKGRDWNIDLIPKFLMADGKLVSLLIQTGVTRYLEFKICEGSYVFKGGKVHKVPANDKEGIGFSLMGLFEKRRFMKVMSFANEWEADNPKTHGKFTQSTTAQDVYNEFGVDGNTQDIIGHALALYTNDDYKTRQYPELMKRLKLYAGSVSRHGQSPFLYPLYGLAELPQAFARLSAIYGGTYMLDKPTDEIVFEDGKAVGVKSQGEVAKCKQVICDPTYAMDRCKKVGQVVRAYCIMKHMVKDTKAGSTSCQIIIPQHQVNRNSDIYILVVSDNHKVAAKGFYYGIVSTTVETNNPEAELKVGIDLLGELEYKHIVVSDVYEPTDDGSESGVFISKSYDATTHFESTCDNVVDMFSRAFGGDYVPPKERQEGED